MSTDSAAAREASTNSRQPKFRNPAPDLTPEQFIQKIVELRPLIREQQERADQAGGYVKEVHEALLAMGAYGVLQPRRYGGHEFDIPTFLKAVVEMGRSDPGSAWCYCFSAGHVLMLAAHFEAKMQEELFGSNDGVAIGPMRAPTPSASIRKAPGGYIVNGTWDYGSGIKYANLVMATAPLVSEDNAGGPPEIYLAVVPEGKYRVIEDSWGGDSTLGLRASASHTFVVDNAFVPEHYVVPFDEFQRAGEDPDGTPGTRLHGNPMYLGLTTSFFNAAITSVMVGAAWAMLDEFEQVIRTKKTINPPFHERYKSAEFQRVFGVALMDIQAAETLLMEVGRSHMKLAQRWKDGTPYTIKEDFMLAGMSTRAAQLAVESIDKLFYAGGSGGTKKGARLNRYFRDMAVFRTHPIAQFDMTYEAAAQAYFGLPVPILEAVGGSRKAKKS